MGWKRRICVVLAAAGLLIAVSAPAASAQATVEKDFFTGGPVFTPLGAGTIENSNFVQTPSGNWMITVQATLDDLASAPERAERWDEGTVGTFCWEPGEEMIRLVVTPTGKVSLTCASR